MENQNSEIYEDNVEVSAEESHEHPQEETIEDARPEPEFDVLCAALDGLLLIHNKPLPLPKLAELLGVSIEKTQEVIEVKKANYEQDINSGLQIVVLENGVQLATKARVSEFIQRLDGQKLVSLSLPALETLSVIAFKQPITKAEIDAIRGVNCDGVVSTLLEKKLIYVSGEKAVLGRPRLYSTTQDFLYYFGMQSLKELPLPSIDIPDQLTPEGQKAERQQEAKESEKEFDESQGLLSIEEETAKKDSEAETISDSQHPSDQADGDKT